MNPLHNNRDTQQIYLIAVLRFSDKTVCASYSVGEVDKEGVREQVASNPSAKPGGRYTAAGDFQAIHYVLDRQSRVYAVVSHPKYPPRVAFGLLEEVQNAFQREFGDRLSVATEGSLTKASQSMLKSFCEKYGNPGAVDKLSSVQDKLDVVKTVMQENIQQILVNQEQLERIATSAEHLNEQSTAFRNTTKDLRNKMWWKMIKMRLLIGGLIVVVLILIIVPIVVVTNNAKKASKSA